MDLGELICKLQKIGGLFSSWFGIDSNVESLELIGNSEDGYRVEAKLKKQEVDYEELSALTPSRHQIQDYLEEEGFLDEDGHFIDTIERAFQIGFQLGYKKAKEE